MNPRHSSLVTAVLTLAVHSIPSSARATPTVAQLEEAIELYAVTLEDANTHAAMIRSTLASHLSEPAVIEVDNLIVSISMSGGEFVVTATVDGAPVDTATSIDAYGRTTLQIAELAHLDTVWFDVVDGNVIGALQKDNEAVYWAMPVEGGQPFVSTGQVCSCWGSVRLTIRCSPDDCDVGDPKNCGRNRNNQTVACSLRNTGGGGGGGGGCGSGFHLTLPGVFFAPLLGRRIRQSRHSRGSAGLKR